ncbi:MAG: protein kinase [Planctomycetota bacterium]
MTVLEGEGRRDEATPTTPPERPVLRTEAVRAVADSLLAALPTDQGATTPKDPPRFSQIGPYHVVRRLARGGMGEVYLAKKPGLEKLHAVKVMLERIDWDPAMRERFLRETRVLARVQHPHVCPIEDAGEHEGVPYYAMPYLGGNGLREVMRTQAISCRRAAEIARQVAEAVDSAHGHEVIHRDLKPENLLLVRSGYPAESMPADQATTSAAAGSMPTVRPSDETVVIPTPSVQDEAEALRISTDPSPDYRDHVYVLDFGLAADAMAETRLTVTSAFMGTPPYMAPEQVSRNRDQVGAWTDVYAIGVILYEMCTGRVPFPERDHDDLVQAIRCQEPPLPRRIRPDVPRDLEAIIVKCLEKVPTHRYRTARELVGDLTRLLRGEPVEARTPSTVYRLYRKAIRRPAVTTAAVFSVVIVGLLLAYGPGPAEKPSGGAGQPDPSAPSVPEEARATWSLCAVDASPPGRRAAVLVYDAGRQVSVLYGGNDGERRLGDVWEWDGERWRRNENGDPPSPRTLAAAAYDRTRKAIVLFGGADTDHNNGKWYDDTWVFDGVSWQRLDLPVHPPSLAGHAMAYDSVRAETVLFGGNGPKNWETDETWVFDGETWTQRHPVDWPRARSSHVMCFDRRRGVVVLIGGRTSDVGDLSDIWEWNGVNWKQVPVPNSRPSARGETAGAYDMARGAIVLFGGTEIAGSFLKDTWVWDGRSWQPREGLDPHPTERTNACMTYDEERDKTLLFGGGRREASLNETWLYGVAR